MNKVFSTIKYFYLGLQFSIIIILPFIVCIFLGNYLQNKFNLGNWVTLVSIFVALIFMVADLYSFGKMILKDINKKSRDKNVVKQNDKR